jgi:PAS domain S-box-containing protein
MATTKTTKRRASHPQAEESCFAGGGTMGALMRAYDWAASPLGPVHDWPPCLRAVVSLALNSQFPIVIFWGPELRMLYNDAYLPILADKHPASLGQAGRDCWPEIWAIAGPMLEGVLATGQATWSYDLFLPIIHNGAVGEHYFTFSYSPIRDEAGMVRGVFCPVTETTARLLGERREQQLRTEAEAARDQVTQVLESMSDSFVAFDSQWRITAANASAAVAMHHRREDLLGKVYWDEFPPTRDTNLSPEFRRAMADRVAVEFESYYPPWERWYDVRVYPVSTSGLSVFFRDITARKQAEEERERLLAEIQQEREKLQIMLSHITDEIWFCDVDGLISLLNNPPAGRERLPWETYTNQRFGDRWNELEIYTPDGNRRPHEETPLLRAWRTGEVFRDVEEVIRHPDTGKMLYRLVSAAPIRDTAGRFLGAVAAVHDFTERHRQEEAQVRLTTELQRINTEFQQFAYIVSHDLGEPLRTMRNFIQLLAHNLKGTLDDDATEFMTFVTDAAVRMQQMLADLLAYTRAGQTPEFQAVDCEALLAQVLTALQTRIMESEAVITHDPLPTIQGDTTRLGQVLQNLIGNALKFCKQQPRIHISAIKEGHHWKFAVRDNGIGIDPQQAGRLFQVFQRLHSRHEYSGTGIGLAICKKIVEQHGGRIWVDSRLGEGATFHFIIRESSQ